MQPGGHLKSAGCITGNCKGPDRKSVKLIDKSVKIDPAAKAVFFNSIFFLICTGYVSPLPRTHSVHKLTSRGTIFPRRFGFCEAKQKTSLLSPCCHSQQLEHIYQNGQLFNETPN
jgi:hypothetical protein